MEKLQAHADAQVTRQTQKDTKTNASKTLSGTFKHNLGWLAF